MRKILVLIGTLIFLAGPTTIYTIVGRRAMKAVSKRPSRSARVMLSLLFKLVLTAGTILAILFILLKTLA